MKITPVGFAAAIAFSLIAGIFMGCSTPVRADQPHMQAALDALTTAEHELSVADEDKGGHRVSALRATRNAIAETREGIAFARNH
jgi:hypothetical protein